MPEVKLGPEAQPRDANNQGVLFLLDTKGRKHILIARIIAEGPDFLKYWFLILKIGLKVDNYEINFKKVGFEHTKHF